MTTRYSLDSIIVRGPRLFGWGFCLETAGTLERCALEVPLVDGRTATFDVLPGGYREDLVAAFPDVPHAGGAGFMVNGVAEADIGRGQARVLATTRGGLEITLPLEGFPEAFTPATDLPLARGFSRIREIARSRGWFDAATSTASGVVRRIRRSMRSTPATGLSGLRAPALVFDHAMGGGANRYRDERVAALRAAGRDVVLAVPELATLSYRIVTHASVPLPEFRYTSQAELLLALRAVRFQYIEINNLVGFEDPPALLDDVLARKAQSGAHLRFQLHDFHAVCPSFTLIDAMGRHCGIPDIDACRRCLPGNARQTLGMHAQIDPLAWRHSWERMLGAADEIVAFSDASVRLLAKGLPSLDLARIVIEPHRLDATALRPVAPNLAPPTCVAAVGHLNHAKGAEFIRQLAMRAGERQLPLRFLVVGTLEGGSGNCATLRVTGRFARASMCDLLEAEGVGIALLPSVCPETYSYVADEIMAMGLPLAVLDVGAPPERVSRYHSGLVLPRAGLDDQLDALVGFAESLRMAGTNSNTSERNHG